MPSPTWRTLPTSARSVSTSYCSIRWRRIEVISSGRSFTRDSFQALPGAGSRLVDADGRAALCARVAEAVPGARAVRERAAETLPRPPWERRLRAEPTQRGEDGADDLPGAHHRQADADEPAVVGG